jgi:hypothetical protein
VRKLLRLLTIFIRALTKAESPACITVVSLAAMALAGTAINAMVTVTLKTYHADSSSTSTISVQGRSLLTARQTSVYRGLTAKDVEKAQANVI